MLMTDRIKGLSSAEVEERVKKGLVNGDMNIKTKSVKQIIFENTLTFFNFLNIALAVLVIVFGELKNAMFAMVIVCNTAIGIIQEIRSKRIIDRLTLISAPKAVAVRDGGEKEIATSEIVLDDLLVFRAGSQISADCDVVSGECEVNESLITGESDPVYKKEGEKLLSGSFIVSGEVKAVASAIGADSFANKITGGAKYFKKTESKMMNAINKVLKVISICIIPMMAILIYDGIFVTDQGLSRAVTSTVAAVIGMIPEGLVLLSSVVLAVSSIRLAMNKTLVQDLYCIETLARVDVLCLDKTGTITEGSMQVEEVMALDNASNDEIDSAMTALMCSLSDGNPTFNAAKERWSGESDMTAERILPFSSAKKWSGAQFKSVTFIMGAGEFILGADYEKIRETADKFSEGGRRVILLAKSDKPFREKDLPESVEPVALIAISDKIRAEAPDTLRYFKEQGVEIKIISGDNPVTVSAVAEKAGVFGAEKYIDASRVENIAEVIDDYTVFGRVTPSQKLEIVKALKAKGHTVGMTGDGVNDVLALKEADCSVAMQSGSDAARNVSNLVLLDSNFASMPKVVSEGRRSINNVERSAVLFLSKTVYSFLLAVLFIIIRQPFLFEPIHMTLVNALTIGAPSFLLALQVNKSLIKGSFVSNVMKKAVPNGISVVAAMGGVIILTSILGLSVPEMSTTATIVLAALSFMIVIGCCRPFKAWKAGMVVVLVAAFVGAALLFSGFFDIVPVTDDMLVSIVALSLGGTLLMAVLGYASRKIADSWQKGTKANV